MTETDPNQITNPYYAYGVLHMSDAFSAWEAGKGDDYQNYRQQWLDRPKHTDPGEFPLNLNVEVTTRCNLACTFCTHSSLEKEQTGDISFDLYLQLLQEGEAFGLATVNLNGLGEPMLRKDMPEFIRAAKSYGVVDVMFHTNGTIMNDTIASSLIESGLDRIVFSVDSPDKNTYEAMRLTRSSFLRAKRSTEYETVGTSWDRMVQNVKSFVKRRNDFHSQTPMVRVTMVVTDNTVHQIPQFVELWKDYADMITVQDLTWRTKLLDDGDWKNQESSALPTDFDLIRETAIEKNLSFVCPYLYQSTYAFFDGTVIPCSNPNARVHMIMGNLEEEPLSKIWSGKEYEELRELHETGRWHEHPVCRDCEVPIIELFKVLNAQSAFPGIDDGELTTGEDSSLPEIQVTISDNRGLVDVGKSIAENS